MCLFFITTLIFVKQSRDTKADLNASKTSYNHLDSLYIEASESRLHYMLVAIELNNITDSFRSSREDKENSKKLNELIDKR